MKQVTFFTLLLQNGANRIRRRSRICDIWCLYAALGGVVPASCGHSKVFRKSICLVRSVETISFV